MTSTPCHPSRRLCLAALAATLAAATVPAQARVLAFGAYPQGFFDNTYALVPLAADGGTSLTFSTFSRNQKVIITFSAECANGGTNLVTMTDLEILVDGVVVAPTNASFNGFCSSNGTINFDGIVSASTTVVAVVPRAGTHTLEIGAHSSDSSSFYYLYHTSTVIHD